MVGFGRRKTWGKCYCLAIENEIFEKISSDNSFEFCSGNFINNKTYLRTIISLAT